MSALLVYRHTGEEVTGWAADVQQRSRAAREKQRAWGRQFTAAHLGADAEPVGFYVYDNGQIAAVAWPDGATVPTGWRRPAGEHGRIVPRLSTRAGKDAEKALAALREPDMRHELTEHGLPAVAIVGLHMYRPGIRTEDDGVWVTYGDRAAADQIEEKATAHGWARVPLTQFIARFGEDAL